MHSLLFIYPYAVIFWPVYFLAFFLEWKLLRGRMPAAGESRSQDRRSFPLIMAGIRIASVIAFVCAGMAPSGFSRNEQLFCFWTGFFLLVAGAMLRRHCFAALGNHFKPVVTVVPNQPVIERGAYKWIRHPSYLAAIPMFLGIGIALANWISILVMLLIPIALYGYRIHVEEQALVQSLGAPYSDYMTRTKRLIPFLF